MGLAARDIVDYTTDGFCVLGQAVSVLGIENQRISDRNYGALQTRRADRLLAGIQPTTLNGRNKARSRPTASDLIVAVRSVYGVVRNLPFVQSSQNGATGPPCPRNCQPILTAY